MNKNKLTLSILLSLVSLCLSANALSVTSFGSSSSFLVDPTYNEFGTTQNASDIDIAGTDLQVFSGTFNSVDLSSLWGNDLSLMGSATTAPSSTFVIVLYDSSDNEANFTGGAWSALASGETLLSFSSADIAFDRTSVFALDIKGGGGGDTVAATLTGLSVVPEPSTYAMLSGLCVFGFAALRRRRA